MDNTKFSGLFCFQAYMGPTRAKRGGLQHYHENYSTVLNNIYKSKIMFENTPFVW